MLKTTEKKKTKKSKANDSSGHAEKHKKQIGGKRVSVTTPKKLKKSGKLNKTHSLEGLKKVEPTIIPEYERSQTLESVCKSPEVEKDKEDNKARESLQHILKSYTETLKRFEHDRPEKDLVKQKNFTNTLIAETIKPAEGASLSLYKRPRTFLGKSPLKSYPESNIKTFSTAFNWARLKAGVDGSDDTFDTCCDPNNPVRIAIKDVTNAVTLIKDTLKRTPCTKSRSEDSYCMDLYVKKDFMQYTGSYKERGALTALSLLSEDKKRRGIVTASVGNHAQAICYHGLKMKVPITVVMPVISPIIKIDKCRSLKARVILDGCTLDEAKAIAMKLAKNEDLTYINGYDHPDILAGHGTMGVEILEQVPHPDAIIVPVGGGGLIAGVSTAIKALSKNTLVIGVESEKSPGFTMALAKKSAKDARNPCEAGANGDSIPVIGCNTFATAEPLVDKILVVKEEWIALAITRLVEEEKCVIEGGGAIGFAAILQGLVPDLMGKKVVVILSGGNIDTTVLVRCLERGMALEGRLIKFTCQVSDQPGGIRELCDVIASQGVSIIDIIHERAWVRDIFAVEVKVICETRDWDHALDLREALIASRFKNLVFPEKPVAAICRND